MPVSVSTCKLRPAACCDLQRASRDLQQQATMLRPASRDLQTACCMLEAGLSLLHSRATQRCLKCRFGIPHHHQCRNFDQPERETLLSSSLRLRRQSATRALEKLLCTNGARRHPERSRVALGAPRLRWGLRGLRRRRLAEDLACDRGGLEVELRKARHTRHARTRPVSPRPRAPPVHGAGYA